MQLPETTADHADIHAKRGKLIDAFVAADDFIQELERLGHPTGPADATTAEKLAIRLLVKRFGWVMTAPGHMQKVRK